jgi:hypothetical protein
VGGEVAPWQLTTGEGKEVTSTTVLRMRMIIEWSKKNSEIKSAQRENPLLEKRPKVEAGRDQKSKL